MIFTCCVFFDKRTENRVFNVGSGVNHSIGEIYTIISDLLGIHVPLVHKPDLPGEAEVTLADIREACALGWRPKTDLTLWAENVYRLYQNGDGRGQYRVVQGRKSR